MTEPLIQARNLTRVYTLGGGDVYALAGVDCDINAGEYVAIMGPLRERERERDMPTHAILSSA